MCLRVCHSSVYDARTRQGQRRSSVDSHPTMLMMRISPPGTGWWIHASRTYTKRGYLPNRSRPLGGRGGIALGIKIRSRLITPFKWERCYPQYSSLLMRSRPQGIGCDVRRRQSQYASPEDPGILNMLKGESGHVIAVTRLSEYVPLGSRMRRNHRILRCTALLACAYIPGCILVLSFSDSRRNSHGAL